MDIFAHNENSNIKVLPPLFGFPFNCMAFWLMETVNVMIHFKLVQKLPPRLEAEAERGCFFINSIQSIPSHLQLKEKDVFSIKKRYEIMIIKSTTSQRIASSFG